MTTNGIMFHSTNNNTPDVDFKTSIIRGQALDKGLYMLNEIPKIRFMNFLLRFFFTLDNLNLFSLFFKAIYH